MTHILHTEPNSANPAPRRGVLGNNTKSNSTDVQTRSNRYRLQATAAYLTRSEAEKRGFLVNDFHRVSKCRLVKVKPSISVYKRDQTAFYSNLSVCGSGWVCPLCASKIQAVRRFEIAQALAWASRSGLSAHMVTLTFPHDKSQSLITLLAMQKTAFKFYRSHRSTKQFQDDYGFEGLIRSLEITASRLNGWHPHTHELLFFPSSLSPQLVANFYKKRWLDALIKAGFEVTEKMRSNDSPAFDFISNAKSSDYLAKMGEAGGVDYELSGAKKSGSGRHIFTVLDDFNTKKNKTDAALFIEFLEATKGKAQVFFSRGLKKKAGIEIDLSDEQIAVDSVADDDGFVITLDDIDFDVILKNKARSDFLSICEIGGSVMAKQWLTSRGAAFFEVASFGDSRPVFMLDYGR